METKVTWTGVAALVAGAIVQSIQDQGVTAEALIGAIVAAVVGVVVGWLKRNGNLAESTLEAASAQRG